MENNEKGIPIIMTKYPEWVFATNNAHKLRELREIAGKTLCIFSLEDKNIQIDIPEPFDTIQENALHKAKEISRLTNLPVISDDTGLEVDALGGAPGVFSARYAGAHASGLENCQLLLENMTHVTNRSAQFITCLVAILPGMEPQFFEGTVHGMIHDRLQGIQGFGYDPVFIPNGYKQTFAELPPEVKNQISHRKEAFQKFYQWVIQDAITK